MVARDADVFSMNTSRGVARRPLSSRSISYIRSIWLIRRPAANTSQEEGAFSPGRPRILASVDRPHCQMSPSADRGSDVAGEVGRSMRLIFSSGSSRDWGIEAQIELQANTLTVRTGAGVRRNPPRFW